ncbi:MAG: flavin reductase family protein [Acidilobaceae archaeon]
MRNWVYLLHPRPAFVVVSGSWDDYSAMAASWLTPISRDPPLLGVAISPKRYTYEKIVSTREFAVCVLPWSLVDKLNFLGWTTGREVKDKIAASGLTKAKARVIGAPIIAESVAVIEAKLHSDIELGGDHRLVVGLVEASYVQRGVSPHDLQRYDIPLHIWRSSYVRVSNETRTL